MPDDAFTDAIRGFLIQDGERCPDCSSPDIDVADVEGEIAVAKCLDCGFQLETDEAAVLRPDEYPRGFDHA